MSDLDDRDWGGCCGRAGGDSGCVGRGSAEGILDEAGVPLLGDKSCALINVVND